MGYRLEDLGLYHRVLGLSVAFGDYTYKGSFVPFVCLGKEV